MEELNPFTADTERQALKVITLSQMLRSARIARSTLRIAGLNLIG